MSAYVTKVGVGRHDKSETPLKLVQLGYVCLAQACALLPVFLVLPVGFAFYWLFVATWRSQIQRQALQFPGRFVKLAAAMAGVLALFFSFTRLISVEAFVAFFLVSYTLKLLELKTRNDASLILSLGFVALASGFLFHQGLIASLYALLAFMLILQAWLILYRLRRRSFFAEIKSAGFVLVLVLPMTVILFLVMPRMGQLWHMPSQSQVGNTGFSSVMSPGSFSGLIQSDNAAFRVSFERGNVPSPQQRYWRGLVLDTYDGREWSRKNRWRDFGPQASTTQARPEAWSISPSASAPSIRYAVLIEPHLHSALFVLMAPNTASSSGLDLRFGSDATLSSREPVSSRAKYRVQSHMRYQYMPNALTALQWRINTQLPPNGNTESRAYAEALRRTYGRGASADRDMANAMLRDFNAQFHYTLRPPLMTEDAVDAFLFEAKQGFCEHFAGSFVFVMRAAGIPARVVVGYQGGEWNPQQGYMLVRQRDAHAWAEIWLEGEGWVRVDPTAAVAPERIEAGLSEALSRADAAFVGGLPSRIRWVHWMENQFEVLNYRWQSAVLSYDTGSQMQFFSRFLGGREGWRIALFLVLGVVTVLAGYFVVASLPMKRVYRSPASRLYASHLRQLARYGFVKQAGETPEHFAHRVAEHKPEWRSGLTEVAALYSRIEYGGEGEQVAALRRRCRRWRA